MNLNIISKRKFLITLLVYFLTLILYQRCKLHHVKILNAKNKNSINALAENLTTNLKLQVKMIEDRELAQSPFENFIKLQFLSHLMKVESEKLVVNFNLSQEVERIFYQLNGNYIATDLEKLSSYRLIIEILNEDTGKLISEDLTNIDLERFELNLLRLILSLTSPRKIALFTSEKYQEKFSQFSSTFFDDEYFDQYQLFDDHYFNDDSKTDFSTFDLVIIVGGMKNGAHLYRGLNDYLYKGGKVFLMLDPVTVNESILIDSIPSMAESIEKDFLFSWLENMGIIVDQHNVLMDRKNSGMVRSDAQSVSSQTFSILECNNRCLADGFAESLTKNDSHKYSFIFPGEIIINYKKRSDWIKKTLIHTSEEGLSVKLEDDWRNQPSLILNDRSSLLGRKNIAVQLSKKNVIQGDQSELIVFNDIDWISKKTFEVNSLWGTVRINHNFELLTIIIEDLLFQDLIKNENQVLKNNLKQIAFSFESENIEQKKTDQFIIMLLILSWMTLPWMMNFFHSLRKIIFWKK